MWKCSRCGASTPKECTCQKHMANEPTPDALVYELRGRYADAQSMCGDTSCDHCALFRDAADRIEQLTRGNKTAVAALDKACAEIEQLTRELQEARDQQRQDYALLLDAWRDRGEPVPGASKQSTIQRVLTGIHELKADRDAQVRAAFEAGFLVAGRAWAPKSTHPVGLKVAAASQADAYVYLAQRPQATSAKEG